MPKGLSQKDLNAEWFNDPDFWEQYAPIMFDDAHWAEVPLVADGITSLANFDFYGKTTKIVNSSPKVLDLCCGFGRISAELARRGFSVTGVDITESYLQTAKEEASHEKLNIEYLKADAREFVRPDFFDLAVNLYISFGYFENEKDDLLLVRNVCESLREGGSFIIETLGKEIAVRDFVETEWFERAGFTVLTQYEILDSWTFLKNRWILIKDGKRIEKVFTQRLYSASELRALMFSAGFSKVEIFGDWNESPYDKRAAKLIVIGRK
ncbi:MAG: class I SAM-dependent methyltransferase [Treponema sp.]|nr:class I SAM-dependent methyltransferase [Treponema sp.]